MEPKRKISPAVAAIIVIVLVGLATAAVIVINSSKGASAPTASSEKDKAVTPSKTDSSNTDDAAKKYKDGSYTANGSYLTPGGQESVDVQVVLTDGTVTDTTLTQKAISGDAKEYQAQFASGYKSLVVGKKIDDISLSRVAGSSLTSGGFNRALEQIKSDASV